MITKKQVLMGRDAASVLMEKACVAMSLQERDDMEVTDFGLENYPAEGAQIITFINSQKVCFKAICLMEGQILPEHTHTACLGEEGKEESFRVVYGNLRLFVPGETAGVVSCVPKDKEAFYTCRKEILMRSPQQVTLKADTPHWLMGGEGGCVVYTVSSWARDALDPFTNPNVVRQAIISD